MPVPRHAWWRDRELTWRRPEALTADVARLCRATDLGAAEPGITSVAARVPEQSSFPEQRNKTAWPPRPSSPAPARRRACRLPRPRPPTPASPPAPASQPRPPARASQAARPAAAAPARRRASPSGHNLLSRTAAALRPRLLARSCALQRGTPLVYTGIW